ncbi:MAG TPA: HPr family phosphocarrier protein [Propionibacteriaceae bacterium]|nr:HPr family phosphocarrier protein [Propionibacteriaceae bacterium]
MATREVTIASAVGLHARPAALFVQAVEAHGVPVTLTKGERTVDADSILAVMTLGAGHGDTVTLTADDESVLDSLAALLERDLDAE